MSYYDLGPIAEERPHTVVFGKVEGENRGEDPMDPPYTYQDPLFWLRDDKREAADVIGHLQREAEHFKKSTADLTDLTKVIYDEHISHIQEDDTSDPYADGPFAYYTRSVKGLAYKIHCRVPRGAVAGGPDEEVILDVNKIAAGLAHCEVRQLEHAPDHKAFAYTIDTTGNEVFEVRSLSGPELGLKGTNGEIEWGADATVLFYVTKDETLRDNKVWMHRIGTAQADDVLVFQEDNEIFSAYMGKTLCGRYLLVGASSSETTEEHLVDLSALQGVKAGGTVPRITIRPREKGVRYHTLPHENGALLIVTNADKCVNNKIVLANVAKPADWSTVLVPHEATRFIDDVIAFKTFLAIGGREGGLTRVYTLLPDEATGAFVPGKAELRPVPVAEPVYTHELVGKQNCEYEATTFRAKYSSLTTPTSWIDYCPLTHAAKLVKVTEVGGGFSKDDYVCERRFATAPDGTQVPMSVVYKKGTDLGKPRPTLLYGYGSYGMCIDPSFAISYLPYLDRGVVYVIAHIRGGGEMGRAWYEVQGKYLTKRNTFLDFIACAEDLVATGVTTPELLACEGRSAGGLLIGAVINMRPDLFKAAIAGVPFVDVMTTMCDPSIPLTTGEWEEWGNPNNHKYFDYMLSYSPMNNIKARQYPNVLIVAGLHDPRVAYWEPAKFAVKLRQVKNNANQTEVLLKMDMEAGHFSASDRYKYLREKAVEQAWIVKHLIRVLK